MRFAVNALSVIKQFGQIHALDGAIFNIKAGKIYGLIESNNAGKTSSLCKICPDD